MLARTLTIALLIIFCSSGRAQNITLVGTNKPSAAAIGYGDVWGEGNIACLGVWTGYANNYGVGIFDISNPASPQLLTVYNYLPSTGAKNRFEQGVVRNKILYVGSWGGNSNGGGFHILSLTNPASPVLLSRITKNTAGTVMNGFDDVHTMWLERNFLYLAAHNPGIVSVKVFDVSNPFLPVYLQDIVTTNTTKVHQITVGMKGTQTILYTSGWGGNSETPPIPSSYGQTDIWDVSNVGTQPAQWLGRVYSGYNSHSSYPTPDGNTLVVARETPGGDVSFYDITVPPHPSANSMTNPVPLVVISPTSMGIEGDIPHNPVIVGNLLFQSWYQNGLQIFDITDRTKPVRIGSYDTYSSAGVTNAYAGNWGIYPYFGLNKILISDIQKGFLILDASAVLTATNNYPPLLIKPPVSLTVTQGMNAVFSPVVTGSLLNFKWRFGGATISGATASSLTLSNVQSSNSGNYSVIATNSVGSVTSVVATLSVIIPANSPTITSQPQNVLVYPGNPASFSVAVTGSAPFSYQWKFNGGDILNATDNSFTRPSVQSDQFGSYSVIVSNSYGTVTSSNALLSLLDSPYINGVQATAGARTALISWNTTVISDSLVQFDLATQGTLGFSSYTDATATTNHVIQLTGLTPNTAYSFQVISAADINHYVSGIYQFTTAGGAIIVDDAGNQMTYSGTWTLGSVSTDYFATTYRYANTTGGSATATFRPNLPVPGKYDVKIWYSAGSNRSTVAPYLISYNGGSSTVYVNQTINSGQWVLLATAVPFAAGTAGFVRLSNNASGNVVIADAIEFIYVETQDFPTDGSVPAWWQNFYFGTQTVNPNSDPDGDGYTIAQEYAMGTSPTNTNSRLQIFVQAFGGAARVAFWPYLGNRNYQMLYGDSIDALNWQLISPGSISATPDGHGIFTLSTTTAPQGFYKLAVQITTNGNFPGSFSVPKSKSFSPFASEAICGPNRAYIR